MSIMKTLPNGTKIELTSSNEAIMLNALLGGKTNQPFDSVIQTEKTAKPVNAVKPTTSALPAKTTKPVNAGVNPKKGELLAKLLNEISPYVISVSGLVRPSAIRAMHEEFMRTSFTGKDRQFTSGGAMVEKRVPKELKREIRRIVHGYYSPNTRYCHNIPECCREIASFVKTMKRG